MAKSKARVTRRPKLSPSMQAEEALRAKEMAESKAPAKSEKPAGVIATIKAHLESKSGGTHAEILDDLVKKFPDRTRDGMHRTVKIQCNQLAETTGRAIATRDIQGRGRVYKFQDKGAIPGKEAVKETAKVEEAATT